MYYKRLFTGNTGASSISTLKYMGLDGNPSSTNFMTNFRAVECGIIGNAVVNTLKDCGLTNAHYDATNSFIYFDYGNSMAGIQIRNVATGGINFDVIKNYQNLYFRNPNSLSTNANGTGWGGPGNGYIAASKIFNGSDITNESQAYRFKVIVKGDVKTFFRVFFSSYDDDNAEYGMFGAGWFNYGSEINKVIGFQMHEVNYNYFNPYWVLLDSTNLEYLMDSTSHDGSYTTNNMTTPLLPGTSYPQSGNGNSGTILNQKLTLTSLFFRWAGGIANPKIFFAPYGYVAGTNVQMDSGFSRFFQSGGKRFYQESTICVEA